MTRSNRSWSLLWLLVLSGAALLVYGVGLRIGYYADDYAYYFAPYSDDVFHFFYHDNPGAVIYRPLQSTLFAEVQKRWGMETLPIHLVNLACHILLSWLVAIMVVRLGFSRRQAMIGSAFILLAQINTYAVLSNDTLSQVGGVLFGFLAGFLLYFPGRRVPGEENASRSRPIVLCYLLSLVSLAISLCLKETSTAYIGIVGVALLALNLEQRPRREALLRTAVQILPYIALAAVYMIVRSQFVQAQPKFGEERYDLNIGLNIPKNIGLFLAASSTALSSVTSFVAMQERNLPLLAAVALTIVLFAGLVVAGLWPLRRDRRIQVLLLIYFFGFFPAILFNRVSEHYIYNSFPFLAALVGIGLGTLWQRTERRPLRIALATAMGLLLATHVASIRSKAALMKANGERASDLLAQLDPVVKAAPPAAEIYLLKPPNSATEYSIYVMNDFDILEAGFPGVQKFLGRPDVTMNILEPGTDPDTLRGDARKVVVTMKEGRVIPYGAVEGVVR